MVRNLVGILVEVGRGALQPEDVKMILEKRDRSSWNGGSIGTAPAHGLYLLDVHYDLNYLEQFQIDWNQLPPPIFIRDQLKGLNISHESFRHVIK